MNVGYLMQFKCFTENDIDNEFKEKYKEVWTMSQEEVAIGFGNPI